MPQVTFTFTEDFQRALLRLCQLDEAFNHQVQTHIDPSYFTTEALGWCFKMMQAYYQEYNGLSCTDMPLRQYVQYAPAERTMLYSREVEAVISLGHTVEAEYVKSNLKEFVQRNLFTSAFSDTQRTYNGGQVQQAFDDMRTAMDSIALVEFDQPKRSWFFEELSERQMKRAILAADPTAGAYTTGVVPLDRILKGGIHDGEVQAVISYAKIGKTTWLINQGFAGVYFSRVPVLHINLEGKLEEAENKYEACFANLLFDEVRMGTISPVDYREMLSEYHRLKSLLVIRSFDEMDITIRHIEAELAELKARGFVPKVLIIDYVDLMRARHNALTELEHQMGATRDVKRLTSNRGLATWTAFQAQRPKPGVDEKEHILTSANVADCYAKCRIVDGYGSINVTNKERDASGFTEDAKPVRYEGIWRMYWEAYRAAKVGKLYKLYNDNGRMRVGVKIEEVKRQQVNGSSASVSQV